MTLNRIEKEFRLLRQNNKKALAVYLEAGDPSLDRTKEIMLGLDPADVNILEIGVPFSDPTADGPVIQAASQRALRNGTTIGHILEMIKGLRKTVRIPIVLFGYYNPVYQYGGERFAAQAAAAGVDGVLIVDLPFEEAPELRKHTDKAGIDFIALIAPTTDDARIGKIVGGARGFVYYISITGVTGTAKPELADIQRDVQRIKRITDLPVMVGFGISTPQQAAEIAPLADGIVVGSAFVRLIAEKQNTRDLPLIVAAYAREIAAACDRRRLP